MPSNIEETKKTTKPSAKRAKASAKPRTRNPEGSTRTRSSNKYGSLDLSPSVEAALTMIIGKEEVTAGRIVREILRLHGTDYANAKGKDITIADHESDSRKWAIRWLDSVRNLFDQRATTTLHGRHVIIGLSLLEPALRKQLHQNEFISTLESELKQPLETVLSKQGKGLRYKGDSVPNPNDNPLKDIDDDKLGRAPFAKYLAKRIASILDKSQAYAIHLSGPWGSGKSTLLHFLKQELTQHGDKYPVTNPPPQSKKYPKKKGWFVVTFNAWQHQHTNPPWWMLFERLYRDSRERLSWKNRFLEYAWRVRSGLVFLVSIAVLLLVILLFPRMLPSELEGAALIADSMVKILAFGTTIWAGLQTLGKPLVLRSSRAAKSYVEATSDPLTEIKERFQSLISRIPHNVVIFIDDLDRCKSDYAIELMEGVQTLFRDAPVVFVIAADQNWLNACYEVEYEKLKTKFREPGKPLGALFLEKAFQFSTSVPTIPVELKNRYWDSLINVRTSSATEEKALSDARSQAKELISDTTSENDILEAVGRSKEMTFLEERAIREEAVKRLATPEIMDRTEHTLQPFAPLLSPNPRAMKRLVNAYSANRALATLAHLDINRDKLAVWTILSMQCPQLTKFLEKRPEAILEIGEEPSKTIPVSIRPLFTDKAVTSLFDPDQTHVVLAVEDVERCALLRA